MVNVDFTRVRSYFIKINSREITRVLRSHTLWYHHRLSMGNIPAMIMKKKSLAGITVAMFCLLLNTPTLAGVYKWVDQEGNVHYGDKPGNADASRVPIRENFTTAPRAIHQSESEAGKNKAQIQDKDKDKDRKSEQAAKPEQPAISRQEKQRLCREATSDIAAINSRGRMRERNAKGEYTVLSEKQRNF